jgi:hypothetical protein
MSTQVSSGLGYSGILESADLTLSATGALTPRAASHNVAALIKESQ